MRRISWRYEWHLLRLSLVANTRIILSFYLWNLVLDFFAFHGGGEFNILTTPLAKSDAHTYYYRREWAWTCISPIILQCYVEFDVTLRIFVPKIIHSRWPPTNIILNRSHFSGRRTSTVNPDNDCHVKRIISPQWQSPKQVLMQIRIVNRTCQVTEASLILSS